MKICNLASGSTGNVTYIQTNNYKILLDLGKTKKYIIDKLKEIEVDYKDIDFVFLSHTHDDHISAISTFLKNHKAKLVLTEKMFNDLKDIDNINTIIYEEDPVIEGLDIETFKMSHDVSDIRSFVISEDNKSVCYITDTGYIHKKYHNRLKDKTVYLIESNHDLEMLINGPYPEFLKRRVRGDEGHLSNKYTAIYLDEFITNNTKNIVLTHLSEKNNTESVALETIKEKLGSKLDNINIFCARPNEKSEVIEI